MRFLPRKYVPMLCFCTLLITGKASGQDVSFDPDLFILQPSVAMEDGSKISNLEIGRKYSKLSVEVSVENNTKQADTSNVMLYVGYFESGALKKISLDTKIESEKLTADILDVGIINENSQLKVYVWNKEKPCARKTTFFAEDAQRLKADDDMILIRSRIEKDNNLFDASTDPTAVLNKLLDSGKFSDIDYSSTNGTNWPQYNALSNVIVMSRAYFSPGNAYYMNQTLKNKIDSVLNDWAKYKYNCSNWWYNEIAVPKQLSQLLLYSFDEDESYLSTLKTLALKGVPVVDETKAHKYTQTGGNLTDNLLVAIKIAAAANDGDSMKNVVSYLLDNELSIFTDEGIMADYSFHQHNSFFYSGSYGHVFCDGVSRMLGYLEDTEFMVSDRAKNVYANFILDGQSSFFYKTQSDFSGFGRAISRINGVSSSVYTDSKTATDILLSLSGVHRREELVKLRDERLSGDDSATNFAKHFYLSDITVAKRPNYYVSVRNASKRNIGTEYMNGENLMANYISDGATVIIKTGNEYKNIFPIWDWSRIPGTTLTYTTAPKMTTTYIYGLCDFVGGVTDGVNGVSVMDYKRGNLVAKKSVFLFQTGFTALGAGIKGTDAAEVDTTFNQCIQNGQITYDNGSINSFSNANYQELNNVNWIFHDNVGYYFPNKENIVVDAEEKSGDWNSINSTINSTIATNNVFMAYKNHGVKPTADTYSYSVLPAVGVWELKAYANNPDMTIVSNTAAVGCVWSREASTAGIVFWNKGISNYSETVTIPKEVTMLDEDLKIDALSDPFVLMVKVMDDGIELNASNPKNDSLKSTKIAINRVLDGDNAVCTGDLTTVTINFPQDQKGSNVTLKLNYGK